MTERWCNHSPQSGISPQKKEEHLRCARRSLWCAVALLLFVLPTVQAGFIGDYAVGQFTVVNTDTSGGVAQTNGGLWLVLTGGNTGSGLPGTTDVVAVATGSGLVTFQYSYSSLDFPGYDYAGYLLNGAFVQLANTDGICGMALCPGNSQFSVTFGDLFGWQVGTLDDTGEPGILTIMDFNAPSGGSPVPEPSTGPILLAIASASVIGGIWRHGRGQQE